MPVASEEDARAALRSSGIKRPEKRPPPTHPKAAERQYLARLNKWIDRLVRIVEETVIPQLRNVIAQSDRDLRVDSLDDALSVAFESFDLEISENAEDLAKVAARSSAGNTIRHANTQHARQMSAIGLDVFTDEPFLKDLADGFVRENTRLIVAITEDIRSGIEREVIRGVSAGLRHEELVKEITGQLSKTTATPKSVIKKARNRAKLIARDQTASLQGRINKARQEKLGLKRYRWRTVGDNRVREEHAQRDGQIFSWDSPPEDGHPGQPVQCRCTAEPVLEDLLK